ncbi:hypothetical protein ACWD6R_04380 [Streptomyces sp. NPDC005151]
MKHLRTVDDVMTHAAPSVDRQAPFKDIEGVLPLNGTVPRSSLALRRPAVVPERRRSGERANRLTYEQDDMSVDAREAAGR